MARSPLWRTTDWGYLRLHTGADGWGYRRETLALWAERISATYGDGDVLVYFNNDPGGAATIDAVLFADAVRRAGGTPTRVPTADQAPITSGSSQTASRPAAFRT